MGYGNKIKVKCSGSALCNWTFHSASRWEKAFTKLLSIHNQARWSMQWPCCKSKLVSGGNHQIEGNNYRYMYLLTALVDYIRLPLAITPKYHLDIHHFNIYLAFLGIDLADENDMHPPQGYYCSVKSGSLYTNPGLTQPSQRMVLPLIITFVPWPTVRMIHKIRSTALWSWLCWLHHVSKEDYLYSMIKTNSLLVSPFGWDQTNSHTKDNEALEQKAQWRSLTSDYIPIDIWKPCVPNDDHQAQYQICHQRSRQVQPQPKQWAHHFSQSHVVVPQSYQELASSFQTRI